MAELPVGENPEEPKIERPEEDKPQSKPEPGNETALPEAVVSTTDEEIILTDTGTAKQPQTTNLPTGQAGIEHQTAENMEVHHHTHHDHGKRNWKSYFWEFLMLFLAVFCGFLAEYQLEHVIENQREKKFIKSLVSDLEADTVRLSDILHQRYRRAEMLDSFVILLNRQDAAAYGRYLYYYNSFATRGATFRFTPIDGTMQQLKNAGNLRLIRNTTVSDSIIAYDVVTRALVWGNQDEEEIIDTYRNIAEGVFDGRILMAMRDEDNNVSMTNYDPPLRITEDAVFRLNYRLHMLIAFNKTLRRDVRMLLHRAVNLLALLKKEYHLK